MEKTDKIIIISVALISLAVSIFSLLVSLGYFSSPNINQNIRVNASTRLNPIDKKDNYNRQWLLEIYRSPEEDQWEHLDFEITVSNVGSDVAKNVSIMILGRIDNCELKKKTVRSQGDILEEHEYYEGNHRKFFASYDWGPLSPNKSFELEAEFLVNTEKIYLKSPQFVIYVNSASERISNSVYVELR